MDWSNEQVEEAVSAVISKASADSEFRALVISDVYGAIKEVTGREVPQGFKINVVDGTGNHVNLILPEVRTADDELTETELEAVAGGSKDGATRFFEGVGSIAEDAARTAIEVGAAVAINQSKK